MKTNGYTIEPGADLRDVDLEGAFPAYKKTTCGIVVLEIPADARRTSCLSSRKYLSRGEDA